MYKTQSQHQKPFNNMFMDVRPFSNGTEYNIWQDNNCAKCNKYENESKTEDEAGCKLAFYLDLGSITGVIPLWVGIQIGYTHKINSGYINLNNNCLKICKKCKK